MESAVLDQVTVDIASADKTVQLRATGSVVQLQRLPHASTTRASDENGNEDEEGNAILPDVTQDEAPRAPRRHPRAAFHRAAAALFRGQPGQEARGARHRPALDLRQHHRGAAAPELREDRPQALHSGGPRPHRRRPSCRPISRATSNTTSPPISRTSWTRSPTARSTGARCCASSGSPSPPRSAIPGSCASRKCSTSSTRSSARTSSRPTTMAARARATARPAPTAGSA